MQNGILGHSRSVFWSRWKGDKGLSNTKYKCWPYLLRYRRCSVYERSAVFSADSKYSADHSPLLRFPHLGWSRTRELAAALLVANCHKPKTWTWKRVRRTCIALHIPYLYNMWAQAYINIRKMYINLENRREYPQTLYCQNLKSLGYIFVADGMGLSSSKLSWWALKDARVLKHSA